MRDSHNMNSNELDCVEILGWEFKKKHLEEASISLSKKGMSFVCLFVCLFICLFICCLLTLPTT